MAVPSNLVVAHQISTDSLSVSQDLNVSGTLRADSMELNTLLTENANFIRLNVSDDLNVAGNANASSLTTNTLSVLSGGSASLDSLVLYAPMYLKSVTNPNFVWRLAVDDVSGNLEFQAAPDWEARLSLPFVAPP